MHTCLAVKPEGALPDFLGTNPDPDLAEIFDEDPDENNPDLV